MFLKAILQKESPNQSLPKVSSEAGVRRCSSKQVFQKFPNIYRKTSVLESLFNKVAGLPQHMCFLVNIAKFFDSKSLVASVDLLFLIKSNVRRFLRKGQILSQYALFKHIISRNHFSALLLINLQKQEKLVQNKPLQQRLFDLVFF